jgi:hypothetical protein
MLNVLQMFYPSYAKDEDVIQMFDHKRVCEWMEHVIHNPHECYQIITQDKRNYQPLKKAFFRHEGYLPYISLFNRDLVVE